MLKSPALAFLLACGLSVAATPSLGTSSPTTGPEDGKPHYDLPPGLSQQDIQWATELEAKVSSQNYQPTADELARYQGIVQKFQVEHPDPIPAHPDTSLYWAFDLLQRSRAGYEPTLQERKRYEAIVRLKPETEAKAGKTKAAKVTK